MALSTALDSQPPAAVLDPRTLSSLDENECARVRGTLADAIAGDRAFSARPSGPGLSAAEQAFAEESLDYPFYRQRYLAMQQGMEAGVGRLRERLRARLALRSDGLERLAAVDTVMERALSRRERTLWSAAPVLLGQHFERLRQAAQQTDEAQVSEAPSRVSDAWLEAFRKHMHEVLLAELDVRLQPAQGLLAALRTNSHG